MNDIIRALLTKRGLTEMEEIEEFLSSHPRTAYDPRLMYGMQEAVSAVMDAVRSVRDGDAPDKNILARNIPETLYGKFDSLLPAELRMKDAVLRYYDLAGALSWIKTFRG